MISASTIALYSNATVTENFTNSGTMVGDVELSGSVGGKFTNSGRIFGSIDMKQGADTFDGRGGWVEGDVKGGLGDDLFIVDDSAFSLVELVREGSDTVRAAISWTLGDNFENLDLTGAGNTRGIGNALANTITGNAGDNRINGKGDKDLLSGGDGDDLIFGGAGCDKLNGDDGDDILRGSPSDSITDFVIGEDRVDLSGLQPSLGYIGGGTFSGTAGEVQVTDQGTRSRIKVDVDGDSSWDMKIVVDGVTGLSVADFIL